MKKVVRCFLENNEWKFLLVKHPKLNNWTLPGGHIEKWENLFEALNREIKEEFNLNIEILWNKIWFDSENITELMSPISIYNISYNSNKHWFIKKQEYIFHAKIIGWDLKIQEEEIENYNFFTKKEISNLENTFEQIKKIITKI
jgi:ADP-ribose pyrophosphatase YjhB (NUDIX family)